MYGNLSYAGYCISGGVFVSEVVWLGRMTCCAASAFCGSELGVD
jgi:hypothetical protein